MLDHLTTITIICAAIGAVATGVATVVKYLASVQTGNIDTLTKRVDKLEKRDRVKDELIYVLRFVIFRLRSTLADNGIESPAIPPELQKILDDEGADYGE